MFKKVVIILGTCILAMALTACRNTHGNDEDHEDNEGHLETNEPTPEALRAQFESFFETNKKWIIQSIATDGEDVRLELAAGYEFLMTILLDDIKLTDENRTAYMLSFELTFSDMADLFGGLALEIKEAADIDYFRLTVIFIDVNETEIAHGSFDVGIQTAPVYELDTNEDIEETN